MNTLAVQFHVDRKYRETVQLLGNYIKIKMGMIQNQGKVDITLDQAYLRLRQIKFNLSKRKNSLM